jgi:hypothetical protein
MWSNNTIQYGTIINIQKLTYLFEVWRSLGGEDDDVVLGCDAV